MGIPVAKLRAGLVGGAVLLVLVVAGFLGYARYRAHRFLAGLPARLGVDIRRETNGYTYSQSVGGKTVMTLHAARAVERAGGKVTLHDVSMVLYGRKQDRADRISGAEFEYDQESGVVRAVGEVHIDLQAPAGAAAKAGVEVEDGRLIHVKTSGLVYLQKLGIAATDQPLEFRFGKMTGEARGAEYNADTGMVILQASVRANGVERGVPAVLSASHAELDRPGQRAMLTDAGYASAGRMARGDRATVHLRADGAPERIEAEGNVVLRDPTGDTVTAPRADVALDTGDKAREAHFSGGVRFAGVGDRKGQAAEAQVAFDGAGKPQRVLLTGAVRVAERARAASGAWSARNVISGRMTLLLGGAGELREVEAAEAADLTLMEDTHTGVQPRSELRGDVLRGSFTGVGKAAVLTAVHGTGHTGLHRVTAAGAEQTGSGDALEVILRPGGEVARATETGHAVLTSRSPTVAGKPAPGTSRATAEVAAYDGDTDRLTLTGSPQVVDAGGTVAAGKIVVEQGSGDATAEGGVKATYAQPGAAGPVHVVADHAELQHDAGRALFFGGSAAARMWQGGSQVEAPVLELEQEAGRMTARGLPGAPAPVVHVVLVSNGAKGAKKDAVRVASGSMVYLDGAREVRFGDGVTVEDTDSVVRAREATAFLAPAPAPDVKGQASKAATGMLAGGSVERIVAKGSVEIVEPGRRAWGEQLVYTPGTGDDGVFVLTGSPLSRPRLVDEAQGTVTGEVLTFHSGDRSATVSGGAGQRAQTVTRVKPR